jgi:hypothetical protein
VYIIGVHACIRVTAHADFGCSGTADFSDDFPRAGVRVTSIGERPYFDPTTLP